MEDAAALGLSDAMMAAMIADAQHDDDVEIWPENEAVFGAFLSVSTQWRAVALADGRVHWLGLDYAGARAGLDAEGVTVTPELWRGLCVIEHAARSAFNGVSEADA